MKKLLKVLVVFTLLLLVSIPTFATVPAPDLLVRWVASMGMAMVMYYITGVWWVMMIY